MSVNSRDLGLCNDKIVSVTRTSGNGAPGTTDTYTITLRSGSTYNFTVTNGSDFKGSPSGVYPTLTALETALPTGDDNIYIVSANGHWYYYDENLGWSDGGLYQAPLPDLSFEMGTINADGTNNNASPYNNNRYRTKEYIYLKKGQILKFNHIYKYDYNIMEFDTNKNVISDDGWTSNAYWIAPQDMYVRIVLKKSDNYLNLINRAVAYWHRNDIYENVGTRIIFDLKDIKPGDTLTISSNDNQRWALSIMDKPYGGYTEPNPPYVYDSGWINGNGTTLTHTIESNAKFAMIVWSMADNSNITSKGWLLNPNISIRKTNDDYFLPSDLEEINNDSFYAGDNESLNIENNRISNGIIQWAHRGYNEYAPENTIPSFEMAYKFGLRCMECDVRLTADNVPVILHDYSINRTARNLDGTAISGTVEVANLILPKLRNDYDFGIWFSNEYAGTKIPTFEELIMWCKSKDCYLHIDLLGGAITTTAQLQILYDIVLNHNMQNKVIWEVNATSFIDWLQAKDANTEIIFNPSEILTTANIDTIVSYGLKKISTKVDTTYPVIEYANQKGLQVFLWSANPLSVSNDNIMKYYKYGASGFYTSLQTVDEYLKDYEYVLSQRKDL